MKRIVENLAEIIIESNKLKARQPHRWNYTVEVELAVSSSD